MGRQPLSDIDVSSPVLSRRQIQPSSEEKFADTNCKPTKRLRTTPPEITSDGKVPSQEVACESDSDITSPLGQFLQSALPEKKPFIGGWLKALADPSVCITSLEDVKSIDSEDIDSLPVPPLVKGLFRELNAKETARAAEEQAVLELSAARASSYLAKLRDRNHQPPLAGSKYFQDLKNYRLILTKEEIEAGVRVVAHRLENWCKGERIVLVGLLKGAFMFMSDLCRELSRPYSVYFVEASSYKDGRVQGSMSVSADISSSKFMDMNTKAPHKIVLVDELLDNGKTMNDMKLHFLDKLKETHTENDILTVCLFSKKRARDLPEADITGIPNLPDLWLIGYGLDDRGTKRGWTELFATPKVKIASSINQDEVARLLNTLDDDAVLTEQFVFAGFELPFKSKCRYRVSGLDVQGGHERSMLTLQGDETRVKSKSDIEKILADLPVLKGKYEHELNFAFIAENMALVPEDDIFHGNNRVYGEMRCSLRTSIEAAAKRCGVIGIEDGN